MGENTVIYQLPWERLSPEAGKEGMTSFSLALWWGLNLGQKGSQVVSQTWRQLKGLTEKGSVGAICEGT